MFYLPKKSSKNTINVLIENNILLQKKSAELITSMNELNKNVTNLLNLFEKAARNIEKGEVEEPLARKLDALLEQNKIVARGLLLLEKFVRDKTSSGFSSSFKSQEESL